jgi:hypothetical protein
MDGANKSPKQGFWRAHSAAWKASGLTQQAYCDQEGISYQSFVYQHNRLTGKTKSAPLNFIKAKPELTETKSQSPGLFLVLPNGIRLGINGEVNAVLLQTVLSVAGGMIC